MLAQENHNKFVVARFNESHWMGLFAISRIIMTTKKILCPVFYPIVACLDRVSNIKVSKNKLLITRSPITQSPIAIARCEIAK